MFDHLVVFQFNENITESKEQELVDQLLSFKGVIPGIIDITAGRNTSHETDNRHGFSLGLRVTFESQEALLQYGPHPAHQQFVQSLHGLVNQVIVVDYAIK